MVPANPAALSKLFHCLGSVSTSAIKWEYSSFLLRAGRGGNKADAGRPAPARSLVQCLAPGTGAGTTSLVITPLPRPPPSATPSTLFHRARPL